MGEEEKPQQANGSSGGDQVAGEGPKFDIQLDHVAVAVRSLAASQAFYRQLGLTVAPSETVASEQVNVAMVPMEGGRLELLEPTSESSVIGRFLARRGEGLHHIAIRVSSVDAEFERMQQAGTRLASAEVRVGAGGHRYFFVHPESTGGVLVEIVGA